MELKSVVRSASGAIGCAATRNLAGSALSEAATLPCLSSAGPMGRNSGKLRQLMTRVAKPYGLRAARCSRCEGSLRC
jgi:hypothetical protein